MNVVIAKQFDPLRAESHRVIELTGTRENLAVAEYVFEFLEKRLEHLWREFRSWHGLHGREKKSFCLGVLNGFYEKLARQDREAGQKNRAMTSALICAGDPGLIRFCDMRYPRLRRRKHGPSRVYADSYAAGQHQGEQLVIHKGVAESHGNRGGLLPSS